MSSNVHYINEPPRNRPLSETVNDVKEEFKRFAEIRIAILRSELKEKTTLLKAAAPLLIVGALLAITGFWVLTAALITLIWVAFAGWTYGIFVSCLIVGGVYAMIGIAALMAAYKSISKRGLMPNRTIQVLKEDKIWMQNEARTQS